ncbi:Gfo/Idh/MocA family oxidoreductase [Streptomyces sp. NPDC088910]|uniref:Gfo/Idh/MocA family oxidoreductase n=1 Tax=Streptomyces sp. NPDC088910 TaxID=3365911 RepID=UPI00381E246C
MADADTAFAAADGYDLAVVATPHQTHVELAGRALKAGLHVVVDKPLALTARDAQELAAADAANRARSVFQNRRRDGDFLTPASAPPRSWWAVR